MKPAYIGIGAQKCASTWLHRILEAHPEVCVGSSKEIDFFSLYYDRGYQWYERQFSDAGNGLVAGEISPSYFCNPLVPERVKLYAPDIRIILSLRDPIQRALSNHRHEVRTGHLQGSDLSFEIGLANNPMYIEQGRYATYLKKWLEFFPSEQILVILMDDIENSPETIVRQVYKFVGVDPDFLPGNLSSRFNPSYANRSTALLTAKDWLYRMTRVHWLSWIWGLLSALGFKRIYRGINQISSDALIPAPRRDVLLSLQRTFAPEISELEKLLGRSLESWRAQK